MPVYMHYHSPIFDNHVTTVTTSGSRYSLSRLRWKTMNYQLGECDFRFSGAVTCEITLVTSQQYRSTEFFCHGNVKYVCECTRSQQLLTVAAAVMMMMRMRLMQTVIQLTLQPAVTQANLGLVQSHPTAERLLAGKQPVYSFSP